MQNRFQFHISTVMKTLFCLSVFAGTGAVAGNPQNRIVKIAGTDETVPCTVYAPRGSSQEKTGLVIHLYGAGGSHTNFNLGRPPYEPLREQLAQHGFWLVVPDLGPAHWMNEKACQRLDAVIDEWIKNEKISRQSVHFIGTSMGGGSGLSYITRRPGKIRSMVAIFPMTDFSRWLDEAPAYRVRVENAHHVNNSNREAVLKSISALQHPDAFQGCPIFLLHGDADSIVPVHHSRELADELRKRDIPVTYIEVPKERHRDEIAIPYPKELAEFFVSNNGPRQP